MDSMETNYFESYEDLDVHKLMLQDEPRNKAYKDAIKKNKHEFKDKVVLDVGAGTGILSVLCAQAGAKTVYAVEASSVFSVAEEIAKENKFEHVIKVIHKKVEDLVLPEKVDIIISEWMGFYLLHEAMLDSVIVARDKFLKPGGLLFPQSATLYSAPCSVPWIYEDWKNIEGVSMQHFGEKLRESASKKPLAEIVKPESILSDPEVVIWLDLQEVTIDEIKSIEMKHVAVANKHGDYQGICLWFTCTFPSCSTCTSCTAEPVILSTEPKDPPTHWKQTTIVLPISTKAYKSHPIAYDLELKKSEENSRRYTIEVTMLDADEVEHPEYCPCHLTKCILANAMLETYEHEANK